MLKDLYDGLPLLLVAIIQQACRRRDRGTLGLVEIVAVENGLELYCFLVNNMLTEYYCSALQSLLLETDSL